MSFFARRWSAIEVKWSEPEEFTFDDYFADFRADFHNIRSDASFSDCLKPNSYIASQQLARELLAAGSGGVVYPGVRRSGGTCIVCFRPALVTNVRKGGRSIAKFPRKGEAPAISLSE